MENVNHKVATLPTAAVWGRGTLPVSHNEALQNWFAHV